MAGLLRSSMFQSRWLLVLACLASLAPFLAKPFNMDDPLFIWAAHHIQSQPLNPYGFDVNWYGTTNPMWDVTKNPPLLCYYLAGVGKLFSWSEISLHCAMLLPAILAILGTHELARRCCNRPMLAALLTLITPAMLVSSTTIMCDGFMLAFWIWAVVFWIEGINSNKTLRLIIAGVLVTMAALSKYYGACLIPLLLLHGAVTKRSLGLWIVPLLIPAAVLTAYHLVTQNLYGRGLFSDAASYAFSVNDATNVLQSKSTSLLTALAFTGGCLALITFLSPLLWRRKQLLLIAIIAAGAGLLLLDTANIFSNYGRIEGSSQGFITAQILFWTVGGVSILALAISDVWTRRTAESWLLFAWVTGTFLFAAAFNWTVNGRTILPMTPAVAILAVRRMEQLGLLGEQFFRSLKVIPLVAGGLLAIWVVWADFLFAKASRESAEETFRKHASSGGRFWFQGHWGFQYYMQSLGAAALDAERTLLQRGDIIATPENNTNFAPLGPELVALREIILTQGPRWLTTMKGEVGAGFYASSRGVLPFALGEIPPDRVVVFVVDPQIAPTTITPVAR